MASFQKELDKLMSRYGGLATGIPQIGQHVQRTKEDYREGARMNSAQDMFGLNRAGLGQSVIGATTEGNRQFAGQREAAKAILDLLTRHGELKGQQTLGLLGQFAPIAYQESQKPSGFAKIAGGALGLATKFGIPGLGAANPLEALISQIMGGSSAGQGFANTSNFNLGYGG